MMCREKLSLCIIRVWKLAF